MEKEKKMLFSAVREHYLKTKKYHIHDEKWDLSDDMIKKVNLVNEKYFDEYQEYIESRKFLDYDA